MYAETLYITGKSVTLLGVSGRNNERPLFQHLRPDGVVAIDDVVGIVNYLSGGGGRLENIDMTGADAGVVGRDRETTAGLALGNVHISHGGRGIVWNSRGDLFVANATVDEVLWNAIDVLGPGVGKFAHLDASKSIGVGIYIDGSSNGNGCHQLDGPVVEGNYAAGIEVFNACVQIDGGKIAENYKAGIYLRNATALVENAFINGQKPDLDGIYGDGILSEISTLDMQDNSVYFNARAGISNFGGVATLAGNTFGYNAFSLDGESVAANLFGPGAPPVAQDATWHDLGGNECIQAGDPGLHPCVATSSSLQPPQAVGP
jgi:hypothetical protein